MKIAARLVGHQSPVAVPPGLADRQPEPDRLQRRYVVLCTSGSATVRSMSMTGLPASPGPAGSGRPGGRTAAARRGRDWLPRCRPPGRRRAPMDRLRGARSRRTTRSRLGINAVYGPLIGQIRAALYQPNGYNEGADQFVSDIIVATHRHGWTGTTRFDPRAPGPAALESITVPAPALTASHIAAMSRS